MNSELLVLRVIHVYGAVVWAGTSLFVSFFLIPAIGMAGPAGGPVMAALVKRKLFTIVPIVAVITMLAGLRLMWLTSKGFSAAYLSSALGQTYSIGATFALLTFIVFMAVNHPAIGKMLVLGQQMAAAPEAERPALMAQLNAVRARSATASKANALFISITILAMALGRYM
jgi:uncharacterized membrane protein